MPESDFFERGDVTAVVWGAMMIRCYGEAGDGRSDFWTMEEKLVILKEVNAL